MAGLLHYMALPAEVSATEHAYATRMNRYALYFLALHPPVFAVISWFGGVSWAFTLALTVGAIAGPVFAYHAFPDRPRMVSVLIGIAAMLLAGVLVYIDTGVMQIEMHFYFFVLLALLAVFANPTVIIAATLTVAAHHVAMFLMMPRGVFNYEATWANVLVHVVFLAIESIGVCFVSRTYFDNVIGLSKIVDKRTAALAQRTRAMDEILDNVAQGFVRIGLDGTIDSERSRVLTKWFGKPTGDMLWWDYVSDGPEMATWLKLGFEGLRDDFMPAEAVIDQLPKRMLRDSRELAFEYRALGEPVEALLAVVTDVTDEVARRRVEDSQRELIAVMEKATHDRSGFAAFVTEAADLVSRVVSRAEDVPMVRRHLHTLKGNAAAYGASSISELAHQLETELEQQGEPLDRVQRDRLLVAWRNFQIRTEPLGVGSRGSVVLDREEYQRVLSALASNRSVPAAWLAYVQSWGLDATRPHLLRMAQQAVALTAKLGKGDLEVEVVDNDLRVDDGRFHAVWPALVHAVRNAVAHGVEFPERRTKLGKSERPKMRLSTTLVEGDLVVEIRDDGAGVDWDRVAKRAKERGLPAMTRNDLDAALFAGGVSTADEVTEVSGRGVGLDALHAACRSLGGHVEIDSEPGRGTVVRCIVALMQPARRRTARQSVSA